MPSFSTLFVTITAALLVRGADNSTDSSNTTDTTIATDTLTSGNSYGAPLTPWEQGTTPGWYYGDNPDNLPDSLTDLPWLQDSYLCWLLEQQNDGFQCPTSPSSDGYTQLFSNLTGATEAVDYMTYGLVDTVEACKAMCDSVNGCIFVNSYHDVNGKNGSPLLTCSLFSQCHSAADSINRGGQTQPDGSIDYITNSDGYCKQKCSCSA
ncbi:uncharacterized protein BT62DRAFT_906011 [Guyanagaster necrorhizus]|uniref:Fruit-body specific protein a n=1 Tax=Guyanagaster necrorhizus TaxID=856835 RepID=A0A9P7VM41_9AGAR|nr:uncharacterized protein BT62DRAFT_906011 [Guyanagaster necrorhizus MCA 3950]KAG7442466.1 hypothetical protein BT62DRAFT_906011 [Guyanagaster necrorhizus MCA 3950]